MYSHHTDHIRAAALESMIAQAKAELATIRARMQRRQHGQHADVAAALAQLRGWDEPKGEPQPFDEHQRHAA